MGLMKQTAGFFREIAGILDRQHDCDIANQLRCYESLKGCNSSNLNGRLEAEAQVKLMTEAARHWRFLAKKTIRRNKAILHVLRSALHEGSFPHYCRDFRASFDWPRERKRLRIENEVIQNRREYDAVEFGFRFPADALNRMEGLADA